MADLFEEKARDWDANDMVRGLSLGIGAAIQANVILDETMNVMDFGAGTGLITSQIADKVEKVTAVDVSRGHVGQTDGQRGVAGQGGGAVFEYSGTTAGDLFRSDRQCYGHASCGRHR